MGAVYYPPDDVSLCASCLTEDSGSSPCYIDWQKNPEMNMVSLESFHDKVKSKVFNAPAAMIDEAVVSAAVEFATETSAFKRWIVADLQKDVNEYSISLSGEERIGGVKRVWVNGFCLTVADLGCGNGCFGPGQGFEFKHPSTVIVGTFEQCDKAGGIKFEVSAVPSQSACMIDAEYYDRYQRAIVAGAVASLKNTDPVLGFADVGGAKAYRQEFLFEISKVKSALTEAKLGSVRRIMGGMG